MRIIEVAMALVVEDKSNSISEKKVAADEQRKSLKIAVCKKKFD